MHVVHEAVEMAPALVGKGQAGKEQIHQPGLAAADAAPHVQPAHGGAWALRQQSCEPAVQRAGSCGDEALRSSFESLEGCKLRRV